MNNDLPHTIPHLLAWAAEKYTDSIAVVDYGNAVSFTALRAQVIEAQKALMGLGIGEGDAVAICAPNTREWIVAALAIQSSGAVLVPLSTRAKAKELGFALRRSSARLLFTVDAFLGNDYVDLVTNENLPELREIVTIRGSVPGCLNWDSFVSAGDAITDSASCRRADSIAGDHRCDLMFTSGTTGEPKGVVTDHHQNIRAYGYWGKQVGLRHRDQFLLVNPFFHAFGYKAGWLASLIRGATAITHPVFDVNEVFARIEAEKINVLTGPPTIFQSLINSPKLEETDVSSMRLGVTGGANIPVQLIRDMREKLGLETVISAYGLTESCGLVAMCGRGDDLETIANTSGYAVDGVEVRCVEDESTDVGVGETGELLVRGYTVMREYFRDENATKQAISSGGWLHTGDIGSIDGRGYISVTGRKGDMFHTGGFNCYPAEIEDVIREHPNVSQVAVVGVPDDRLGYVGMAFIQFCPGQEVPDGDLSSWCKERISNYKVPRYFRYRKELPMTDSGKIHKARISKMAREAFDNDGAPTSR